MAVRLEWTVTDNTPNVALQIELPGWQAGQGRLECLKRLVDGTLSLVPGF
jgi:hypothetical protein